MTVKNRLKQLISDKGITPYRFWKDTGLSRPTAYRMVSDPCYPISTESLDKICKAYDLQPGDILYWEKD